MEQQHNRSIQIPNLGDALQVVFMMIATGLLVMLAVFMWGQIMTERSPVSIIPWPNIEGVAPICLVAVKNDGRDFLALWCSEQAYLSSGQPAATNPPGQ